MTEELKNDKLLKGFRKGYKKGFADGYKQAMLEVVENRKKMYLKELITLGVEGRPPRGHSIETQERPPRGH